MITTIEIDAATEPAALCKLFRKKAMTGGGFIKLKNGLGPDELSAIYKTFSPELERHSLAERVLVALAAASDLPDEVLAGLEAIDNSEIRRAIARSKAGAGRAAV